MQKPQWRALRRYLVAVLLGNLIWETIQLPLYTIWTTGTLRELTIAVFHCTVGDLVIAASALAVAVILTRVLTRDPSWPRNRFWTVAGVAMTIGIIYTIYSERSNMLAGTWTYADPMPVLPWLDVGLSPVLQWLFVPAAAFFWANRNLTMRA